MYTTHSHKDGKTCNSYLPESSLKSSQRLAFPLLFLWSSEEEDETLESSESELSEDDSFAAQKRDMLRVDSEI